MRIPLSTKKGRYYVATSMSKAFSSWSTLAEARESATGLSESERAEVIGIVSVIGVHTKKHTTKE